MSRTSIIILTHNQMYLTALCLESIRRHTPESYELIVVDNGSTDGTVPYLLGLSDLVFIRNEQNLGFAEGCNQGYEKATGDAILFLNNDTIVTPGWLSRMLKSLYSRDDIGMTGPVSNYVSGPQQIPVDYKSLSEMDNFALKHAAQNDGLTFEVRRIVGFCMLVKRQVLEEVGCFDNLYGLGNYEDDDLCLRVIHSGYRIQIAYDSFVHHFGHMTMALLQESTLNELLVVNKEKARQKWGGEIHSLLYKVAASLTVIVPIGPRTMPAHFEKMIDSVASVADEWIMIDSHATDEVRRIASKLPGKIIQANPASSEGALLPRVCSEATKQYFLLIHPEEILTPKARRGINGLKIQLDGRDDGISMLLCFDSDGTHTPAVRRIRMVRSDSTFDWDPAVQEFVMHSSAVIKQTDIPLAYNNSPKVQGM